MASHTNGSSASAGISIYEATVPVFIRGLKMLDGVLTSATKHAESHSIDANASLPSARLIHDMRPLSFQIQVATDTSKKTISRILKDKDLGSWEDNETTLEQLHARLAKGIAVLEEQKPEEFAGAENNPVELKVSGTTLNLSAKEYVLGYGLPNFFFHVQTAYAIIRANGVPVGKRDYLRPFLEGRDTAA